MLVGLHPVRQSAWIRETVCNSTMISSAGIFFSSLCTWCNSGIVMAKHPTYNTVYIASAIPGNNDSLWTVYGISFLLESSSHTRILWRTSTVYFRLYKQNKHQVWVTSYMMWTIVWMELELATSVWVQMLWTFSIWQLLLGLMNLVS